MQEPPVHPPMLPGYAAPIAGPGAPGQPAPMEGVSLILDAQGHLDSDVACLACGYNLRGTTPDGECPECGQPVGVSLLGNLLRFAEPSWLARLRRGLTVVIVGTVMTLLLGCLGSWTLRILAYSMTDATGQPANPGWVSVALVLMSLIPMITSVVGVWLLTTPEPRKPGDGDGVSVRAVARTCMCVGGTVAMLQQSLTDVSPLSAELLGVPTVVFAMVGLVALLMYLRRLADRMPQPGLVMQTTIVMWGVGVMYSAILLMIVLGLVVRWGAGAPGGLGFGTAGMVGVLLGCVFLVAGLVFGIWSIVLLALYRVRVGEAEMLARDTWQGTASPAPPADPATPTH